MNNNIINTSKNILNNLLQELLVTKSMISVEILPFIDLRTIAILALICKMSNKAVDSNKYLKPGKDLFMNSSHHLEIIVSL